MIGDVLLIERKHERVARELAAKINKLQFNKLAISIGGESGSGKSEIAETLRNVLRKENFKVKILHLDNYYIIAPDIRNDYRKENGVSVVGLHEINWDILNENIRAFRLGKSTTIPFLDLYTNQEDKLVTDFKDIDVIIVEGLYACNAPCDVRVFIDITYHETKKAQLKRGKEKLDDMRIQVLQKEHTEVQSLRNKVDYFISQNFSVVENSSSTKKTEKEARSKLHIFSSNLPMDVHRVKGKPDLKERIDGLTVAIKSVYGSYESLWSGVLCTSKCKLTTKEKTSLKRQLGKSHKCNPLFIDMNESVDFCRNTLWPLFHYFPERAEYSTKGWEAYKKFNQQYLKSILPKIKDEDTVWVHGYPLMLLPALIKEAMPNITVGFFLHVPFPSFEIFRLLPWREEILRGLLGADLVGFHTYEYTRHFLSSIYRILGYENNMGNIMVEDRMVHTDAFQLGIDFELFSNSKNEPEVKKELEKMYKHFDDCSVVLSIDRLDMTRGIENKINLIDKFFEKYSQFRNEVIFRVNVLPPHIEALDYPKLKRDLKKVIDKCNKKHGTKNWKPIDPFFGFVSMPRLKALYHASDVLLVTSLREGLNLITKEYLASKTSKKGVLILSEFTGGAEELSDAILVNPNNGDEIIDALVHALTMPEEEQRIRNIKMRSLLERNTALRWAVEFQEGLKEAKQKQEEISARVLSSKLKTQIITKYHTSSKRLIALDYNGTLVKSSDNLICPPPDEELLGLIESLVSNKKNTIVIVSDNERNDLEEWFGSTKVDLISSSTSWFKKRGSSWKNLEPFSNQWMDDIRPIMEKFKDRTPGAYIREKRFALEWHFKKAVKELKAIRSRELMASLNSFSVSGELQVNEGDNVIEVKNAGIYRGRIVKTYINESEWDFMLAA